MQLGCPCSCGAANAGSNALGLSVTGGVSIERTSDGPALSVTGNGKDGAGEWAGWMCILGAASWLALGPGLWCAKCRLALRVAVSSRDPPLPLACLQAMPHWR